MSTVQIHIFLTVVLIPAVTTALVIFLVWRPWRRDLLTPRSPAPVALGVGVLVTELAVAGWLGGRDVGALFSGFGSFWEGIRPALWPVSVSRRIPHIILVAMVGMLVIERIADTDARAMRLARLAVRLFVGLVAALLLLAPFLSVWEPRIVAAWLIGLPLGTAALWALWSHLSHERPGALVPGSFALIAFGLGVVFGGAGDALGGLGISSLGQVSWGLGVCLLVVAGLGWRRPDALESRALAAVPAVFIASVMCIGQVLSADPRPWALGLVALACLVAALPLAWAGDRWRTWPVAAGLLLVIGSLLGGAVWVANGPEPENIPTEEPSGAWDATPAPEAQTPRLDAGRILE